MVMLGGFFLFLFFTLMAVVGVLCLFVYKRHRKVEHLFVGLLSVTVWPFAIYTLFIQ
ncbi:hypothetical protein Amme3_00042 [Pseudomonas phage vB_PpuM-Amme-3]|uniref:Uncharacterized protein n=2 Tax=Tartuvirus TaxID=3424912 RepID=A0AAX4MWW0_9CAUD